MREIQCAWAEIIIDTVNFISRNRIKFTYDLLFSPKLRFPCEKYQVEESSNVLGSEHVPKFAEREREREIPTPKLFEEILRWIEKWYRRIPMGLYSGAAAERDLAPEWKDLPDWVWFLLELRLCHRSRSMIFFWFVRLSCPAVLRGTESEVGPAVFYEMGIGEEVSHVFTAHGNYCLVLYWMKRVSLFSSKINGVWFWSRWVEWDFVNQNGRYGVWKFYGAYMHEMHITSNHPTTT